MNPFLDPSNPYVGANLILLLVFALLSAIVFICFSGFVKYSIILNIIKNAIGTQQIPPSIVVNILASLMALNSIWPVLAPGIERVKPYFVETKREDIVFGSFSVADIANEDLKPKTMLSLVEDSEEYFPELFAHAKGKTEKLQQLIEVPFQFDQETTSFKYFLGSLLFDLYQGFEFGLKLYLIFVSIDFLVAVILSGVGMTMLSPTVISTPLKLAVFYFSDSWTVLFRVIE
ncbi:EscR/YscR/HrcR family type III secretion system export apparatus protein [Vibrio cholerae]|uniref:EscR/YscR/HrcR family type III secretion system export apparatus protein n=1 Tax=Vibrio cholerae TaxID=666 RepID=UPI000E6BE647|nr:EscR/YscR/HrcR family type III secretion system export apparatus protein [Vibrio cholerae]NOE08947.1 EscR/YscR/HrcR family type III secretion system export apparatus protein [Vibrio cholerae]NOF32180.1 EscR/YscR/HrcR family type III secretion system export apparatus protein [Vibrio cholerae]RJK82838.1 EscR/YscR/HrcR family type III secretion system export apparatus protein [Vibrio cholerae]